MATVTQDQPVNTTNGTVTFLDDMNDAALQASRDVNGFYEYLSDTQDSMPGGPEVALGALGAGSGFLGNLLTAAQLGVSVANTVLSNQSAGGSLQITITNNSTKSLALYNYTPHSVDITNLPNPLYTGQTDTVLVTGKSAFGPDAGVELFFSIGNGAAIDSTHNSVINFKIVYTYVDNGNPGRWAISSLVDGSPVHDFPQALQMFGFTFMGNTGYPGFSLYTSPIETSNGELSLVIYDR